ncbi:MAG: class II glutamine amidotransferase [Lentisphaeria bacterium]|nr:class II glutamine amidotransferase [Lentisphaeria bacterium]
MSDPLKHECAVAMLRLRRDARYFQSKYGTTDYALDKITLLLEKQHNRGQDGAGLAALHPHAAPGTPLYHIGKSATWNPLADLLEQVQTARENFTGELLLGHLRYATFGRNDLSCCYPFVHESTCPGRLLLLAGNFNLTENQEMYDRFVAAGHHPVSRADGYLLLQTIAHYLEKESDLHADAPDLAKILRQALNGLDGAFTLCGMTGAGDAFAIRDARGIRPGYFYFDDEVFAVASERPAIQAAFNCATSEVMELPPGKAVIVDRNGEISITECLAPKPRRGCVFERIYFSRGNDADIHRERRELGAKLVPAVLENVDHDFDNTVFSYIPNSAQVCFHGMLEQLNRIALADGHCVRFGQVAVKDAKFRTFITDAAHRRDMYRHVYDVTYGLVHPGGDALVVLDDSIVRGNTMRNAILPMLDRLGPRRIVLASSAPPVKYPDCYGIDMATAGELAAFQAVVSRLRKQGRDDLIEEAGDLARADLASGGGCNRMRMLYDAVPEEDLIDEITALLTPPELRAELRVVFQSCENLRRCCPQHRGDWYFTGDYPTPGGVRFVNRALVNFLENHHERAY